MLSLIIAFGAAIAFFRAARPRGKSGWRWAAAGMAGALGPGTLFGLAFSQGLVPALPADGLLMSHYSALDLAYRIVTVVVELVLVFALYRRLLAFPLVKPAKRR